MTVQGGTEIDRTSALPFFVAGVGASAGGLEALQAFFREAQPGEGIAYVVIQHLSPDFKSMMVELLARHTKLEVVEAADGVVPAPDTIYLIPPKCGLRLRNGQLRVTEREPASPPLPINVFLESLALEQGDLCAAIILSGTGTDGTHGVRLLKEAGGVVLVQDPMSAKFDGMPNSVINGDLADFVASAGTLARRLGAYVKHPMLAPLTPREGAADDTEALDDILEFIRLQARTDFRLYKEGTIVRRVQRRASLIGLTTLSDYLERLRSDTNEVEQLVRELLIGVTQFFRDPEAWHFLENQIIPDLVHGAEPNSTLRLWVAGCATGEEAYTLAMLMEEHLQRVDKPINYRLFATDARRDSLGFARMGSYPVAACAPIPTALRERYFDTRGEIAVVKRVLRDAITFAPHDVLTDPPFTQLDLLCCRNLLIYLKLEAQRRVIARFRVALKENAYLFLGSSESVGDANPQFRSLHGKGNAYVARGTPSLERALVGSQLRERRLSEVNDGLRPTLSRASEVLYEAALKRYVPPGVAVDGHFELLQVFGDVSEIVHIPPGRLTVNLLRMVPQSVSILLNTAGRKALNRNEEIRIPEVPLGKHPAQKSISIRIVPFEDALAGGAGLLVFFEDVTGPCVTTSIGANIEEVTRQRLKELEDELIVARENLQSAVQDLEAANEELQATNEELTASNEELQSTNEELQSVNEELYTVNSEYQQKIGELEELNDDLENVLRATDAGVLFLDEQLTIRRFNETARRLLPVRNEDVGRPLSEIAPHARYPEMSTHASTVLATGEPMVTDVLSTEGTWWTIRLRVFDVPHATRRGVIISMHDVTDLKRAVSELARLTRAHQMAEDICGSGHAILDLTNEVVHFSGGARTLLRLGDAERIPLSTALEMFGSTSREAAIEALQLLKTGLEIPFTAIRELVLQDGAKLKVRMQVQGKVDAVTEDRLMFAVFLQVP